MSGDPSGGAYWVLVGFVGALLALGVSALARPRRG